ncbi:MAG TPA: DUF4129 domain-containing protein [Lysobacter sp.]
MRLDAITVALRPRSSWEAVELGTALVRRHARAIWPPWLITTLPAFAAVNALAAWGGLPALAPLVMWWLKPVFDRVPLFVLSRAVFGEVPDMRTTLRGAFRGGGRAMLGYLTWRRLGPARSLLLPVDVLEGGDPRQASARRRVLAGPAYGVASLVTLTFAHFEAALLFGLAMLVFLFVPSEYLRSSFMLLWQHLLESPAWLVLIENGLIWIATSLLEPFYVGAGFGLYLNRRTEIEGWDIELAFRRLRARLLAAGSGALLLAVLVVAPLPSIAATPAAKSARCPLPTRTERSLREAFGEAYVEPGTFHDAVERAYADPRLHPQRTVSQWKPKNPPKERRPARFPSWFGEIGALVGTLGRAALWLLAGGVLLAIVLTAKQWLPWLRGFAMPPVARPATVDECAFPAPEPLPADIVASVRALWHEGRARDALALLYRAAVEALVTTTGRELPPGATEAQCLRAAQALPEALRRTFARVVRLWQYAAYAERLPAQDVFDDALADAARQFGWRA